MHTAGMDVQAELGITLITFTLNEGCWQGSGRDVGQDQRDAGQDHLKSVGAIIRRRLPATSKPKELIDIGTELLTKSKQGRWLEPIHLTAN